MKKTGIQIKIFSVIFTGFILSMIVNNEVFIADTPQIRAHLGEYIAWRLKSPLRWAHDFAMRNKDQDKKTIVEYLKKNLEPVAQGVRAAEDKNNSVYYTQYNLDEVKFIETTYKLPDGREVVVKSPAGVSPPPKALIESLSQR